MLAQRRVLVHLLHNLFQTLYGHLSQAESLHADAAARTEAELLHNVEDLETERKHNKVRHDWRII